ncbi:MAG: Mrp/NBP35 family ATP-binding protein [Bacteroidia bacterium]|nr:Mrp/NBP35 family ATP-binding protein [Bacteroidia bacterium]MCF8426886.1 Mrp/NBP35 family ATP-binding protein [Bacteroidia bacterium]
MEKNDILKALSTVQEPDLKKDLVTLNMIQDIEINGNEVSFKVMLTTPACPLKDKIEKDCIEAIHKLVSDQAIIKIEMAANVTSNRSDKLTLPSVKNIIAVASGKGGVGKSSVASNLAVALAQKGAKVGLLDADIHGPSVPMMFGVMNEQPLMRNVDGKELMVPIEKHGVKLLSIGFLIKPEQAVVWRGPMVSSALRQFVNDTDWGELDYLILDLPPGTGDIHLTMLQVVPLTGVVMVTTPQAVALADAYKAATMFAMTPMKVPILGVVENMAYFTPAELPENKYYIFGNGGGKTMANELDVPFLGEVPIFMGVREGGDKGVPAATVDGTPIQKVFYDIAEKVAQQIAVLNANPVEAPAAQG